VRPSWCVVTAALGACSAPPPLTHAASPTPTSLPEPLSAPFRSPPDQALESDRQVVASRLVEDARRRVAALGWFVTNVGLVGSLRAASESERGVPVEPREQSEAALRLVSQDVPSEVAFDAVFAIDRLGRVVAHLGFEWARGMDDFELGGYAVVADALHGHSRDDTLVMDRVYRVVARPVEDPAGEAPVGAVMGARTIDDAFARELSQGIGSALVFFDAHSRLASSAPEGFDPADLDVIVGDLYSLPEDPGYRRRGTSGVRHVGSGLCAVHARLPGEGWPLGVGFAVIRPRPCADGG